MAYGPPGSQQFFVDILPAEIGLIEAWLPNFGDCLFKAIEGPIRRRPRIGRRPQFRQSDPADALLVETAELLARPGDRAVLGPSTDGGYYLLGLKRAHRRLFDDIDWSTDASRARRLNGRSEIGLEVHRLPVWYDVDDLHALRQLHAELFEDGSLDPRAHALPPANTAALMYDCW